MSGLIQRTKAKKATLAKLATWKGLLKSGSANGLLSKSDIVPNFKVTASSVEEALFYCPRKGLVFLNDCLSACSLICSPLMETPFVSQLATSTKMAAEDAWWAAASRRHLFSTADSRSSAGNNIWLHLAMWGQSKHAQQQLKIFTCNWLNLLLNSNNCKFNK